MFEDHPEAFIRVIQVIMIRLQRVTFTALHQYLGLSAELVNPGTHKKRHSPFGGSPVRSRTRDNFQTPTADNESNLYSTLADNVEVQDANLNVSEPVPILSSKR